MAKASEQARSTAATAVDDVLIRDVVRKIVERFHPRRILLFGSHARGTADAESDIDLFIEMRTDRRPPERREEILALFGLRPWSLDVVVYTPEEVERLHGQAGTLLSVIESEGRVLHASP